MHTLLRLWAICNVFSRLAFPRHRFVVALLASGHVLHGIHSVAVESGLIFVSLSQKGWPWWCLSAILLMVSVRDAVRVFGGIYATVRRRLPLIRARVVEICQKYGPDS